MIEEKLLRESITAIMKIPIVATFSGRSSLLSGIPPIALNRHEGNAAVDIDGLARQLILLDTEEGDNCFLLLLDTAMWHVRGTTLALELQNLKARVEAAILFRNKQLGNDKTSQEDIVGGSRVIDNSSERDTRKGSNASELRTISTNWPVPIDYVEQALKLSRSVARVLVEDIPRATGFLIKGDLIIVPYFAFDSTDELLKATIEFNFDSLDSPTKEYALAACRKSRMEQAVSEHNLNFRDDKALVTSV